jgi:hypothetical protein
MVGGVSLGADAHTDEVNKLAALASADLQTLAVDHFHFLYSATTLYQNLGGVADSKILSDLNRTRYALLDFWLSYRESPIVDLLALTPVSIELCSQSLRFCLSRPSFRVRYLDQDIEHAPSAAWVKAMRSVEKLLSDGIKTFDWEEKCANLPFPSDRQARMLEAKFSFESDRPLPGALPDDPSSGKHPGFFDALRNYALEESCPLFGPVRFFDFRKHHYWGFSEYRKVTQMIHVQIRPKTAVSGDLGGWGMHETETLDQWIFDGFAFFKVWGRIWFDDSPLSYPDNYLELRSSDSKAGATLVATRFHLGKKCETKTYAKKAGSGAIAIIATSGKEAHDQ